MSVLTNKCRCNSFGRIDGDPEGKKKRSSKSNSFEYNWHIEWDTQLWEMVPGHHDGVGQIRITVGKARLSC